MLYKYYYDGPVEEFDFCVERHWKATTLAVSEAKARCNLAFRYKNERGLQPWAKVSIPGKMTKIELVEEQPKPKVYHQMSFEDICPDLYAREMT